MKVASILSILALLAFSPLIQAQNKPAPLPEIPEVLKETKPVLSLVKGELSIAVTSTQPLTAAQWEAIAGLHPRRLSFAGKALDDAGMDRLVAMNPTYVGINGSLLTGVGVTRFGEMKSLTTLAAMHIVKPTPEAKVALSTHPTLVTFSTDGAFCIEAVNAPKLVSADLKHGAADDKFVALLANHPALETLRLWPKGGATLTDAALAHIATLPKLKKLTIDFSVLSYAGGLNQLKKLPNLETLDFHDVVISDEDLAKLKADLPKVKMTHTRMTPEYRAQWDAWLAKKK